jgi:hypothetical protein
MTVVTVARFSCKLSASSLVHYKLLGMVGVYKLLGMMGVYDSLAVGWFGDMLWFGQTTNHKQLSQS